jgi:S1-C subfamily serine protease
MNRPGWIIAAVAGLLIVGSIVALMALTGQMEYRTMTGPIAVVQGPAPTNGFLGVGFASMSGGPATIQNVMPGSGAAEAGLRSGDVIVAVGEVNDPDAAAVKRVTDKTRPGDVLRLRVRRVDQELEVSVRLISVHEMLQLDLADEGRHRPASGPVTSPAAAPAHAD